ncbi:hypothetical protein Tco_1180559 [Tanacetum coccineum]
MKEQTYNKEQRKRPRPHELKRQKQSHLSHEGVPNEVWALDMVFQDAQVYAIGIVVSMTDCIPFNNFGVDKIRRTLILEDVEYTLVEGYDPKQKIISLFSPVKRELTPQEFFQGAIKKMVGSILEAEKGFHCILYAMIHKIHREHRWAYLACKKYVRIVKQAEDGMKLWNCTIHKGIKETGVGISSKDIRGSNHDRNVQEGFLGIGNGKRAIIDLDDYNGGEEQAKKGKMILKVKNEPDE